uniref:Uncharacterized protein n=1 Tax=Anguilla anguilla TaxID=7936 RepID=A0A0E9SQT6_ANGAN
MCNALPPPLGKFSDVAGDCLHVES